MAGAVLVCTLVWAAFGFIGWKLGEAKGRGGLGLRGEHAAIRLTGLPGRDQVQPVGATLVGAGHVTRPEDRDLEERRRRAHGNDTRPEPGAGGSSAPEPGVGQGRLPSSTRRA